MSDHQPWLGSGERVAIAGIGACALVLLGFCAGGVGFSIHGLGYFAAFPFWLAAALVGVLGLVWGLAGRRRDARESAARPIPVESTAGLGLSAIAVVVGGGLTLVLTALIGLGLFVAVGMLLSHPL